MMDHRLFQPWLSQVAQFSPAQRIEVVEVVPRRSHALVSLVATEADVGEGRWCQHCNTYGTVAGGKARSLHRYQLKGRKKSFNAVTGTPLVDLHREERWFAFGARPSEAETMRVTVGRCRLVANSALRWRYRFLVTESQSPRKLTSMVGADETHFLESRMGERHFDRRSRGRGEEVSRRRLWSGQVSELVAANDSCMTGSSALPEVNAGALRMVIEPVVNENFIPVSEGHRALPPCVDAKCVCHEAICLSGCKRVRHASYSQVVDSSHGQEISVSTARGSVSDQGTAITETSSRAHKEPASKVAQSVIDHKAELPERNAA